MNDYCTALHLTKHLLTGVIMTARTEVCQTTGVWNWWRQWCWSLCWDAGHDYLRCHVI